MVHVNETMWCDGCGVEIPWSQVVVHNKHYCCQDCHQGFSCNCGERMEEEDEGWEQESSVISAWV